MNPIYLLFISTCFLLGTFCQTDVLAQQQYGIVAGMNHATIDHYYGEKEGNLPAFIDTKGKLGYQLGLFWINRRNQRFSWHHELYFNFRESYVEYENNSLGSTEQLELDLNYAYLNYTILPQLHFFEKPDIYLQAGPYIGGRMISRAEGSRVIFAGGDRQEDEIDGTADKYLPAIDFGGTAGIGMIFNLSEKDRLLIEVRDSFGISGMTTNEDPAQVNTIWMNIGYVFGPREEKPLLTP